MIKFNTQSNIIKSIFSLAILISSLFACSPSSNQKTPEDTTKNEAFSILRLDQDLFHSNPRTIDSTLKRIQSKYANFADVYFLQIMNFGTIKSDNLKYIVADFIQNKDFLELSKDVDSIYNQDQIKLLEKELSKIFNSYSEIYPNDTLPRVCTFISGFTNGIVTTDGYIGIGLDLFLGADYRFYPTLDLPEFMIRRYTPEHLLPMFVKGMASYKYPFEQDKPSLLDVMINEGKMLYFQDQLLQNISDTLKLGYTHNQLIWCKENEANIYQLLIQEGLFSTDYLKYRKYTDEAPFTSNLGNKSAPRIAWFCGWQIVKSFMQNNSEYSLDELMLEKDNQKILKLSKYKP